MRTPLGLLLGLSLAALTARAAEPAPDLATPPQGHPLEVSKTASEEGEIKTYEVGSTSRKQSLYPSNWGETGLFRVRSAESLPEGALTFGIGGEFYAMGDVGFLPGVKANTIAESIFVGYAPVQNLTVSLMRRNSSTTFGTPSQLISSLGDVNLSAMYSFPLSQSFAVAPIVNFLIASNFNNLAPSGNTLSVGIGGAATYSFYPTLGVPLFVHANLLYHSPQVTSSVATAAQAFYNFSRYDTVTIGLGAELQLGDFIPFLELYETYYASSTISFGNSPAKMTLGVRVTPLSNKSLAVLVGADVGLSRSLAAGVPFSPTYQVLGQLSYTFGLTSTERKHYETTADVKIVDRKFVLKKNVNFRVGSAVLDPSSTGLLDQISDVVKNNNIGKLLIVGHTDSSHSEEYNLKLSQDRAASVKRYLVAKNVPPETLMTQGYGKRHPKASNLTEAGRQLNRRVEFLVVD